MSYFDEQLPAMARYLEAHAGAEPELLKRLRRETFQKTTQPNMLSGHLQGRFLSILSKIAAPKIILEIGTFTGYATLCLAEGLAEDGKIYTLDINEDLAYLPSKYFAESEFSEQIEFIIEDAATWIGKSELVYDMVFIDADKQNYIKYLELIKPKVKRGGLILIDNVLWHGNVLKEEKLTASDEQIISLNKLVALEPELENVILPLRDGLQLIRKK